MISAENSVHRGCEPDPLPLLLGAPRLPEGRQVEVRWAVRRLDADARIQQVGHPVNAHAPLGCADQIPRARFRRQSIGRNALLRAAPAGDAIGDLQQTVVAHGGVHGAGKWGAGSSSAVHPAGSR